MLHPLRKLMLACLASAPLLAAADEPPAAAAAPPPPKPDAAMGGEMRHGKAWGDGSTKGKCCEEMKGKRCDMEKMERGMMGRGPHMPGGMVMIPRLPPGNEKAQLQMEAEIHQKLAEILSKYAAELK